MNQIHSTLTLDQNYAAWQDLGNGRPEIIRSVIIKGGAGTPNKHIITPLGVTTEVTDEELEFLESNEGFKKHKEAGYIRVTKKKVEVEKVVKDMAQGDKCSPMTPDNYQKKAAENSTPVNPKQIGLEKTGDFKVE